jgi:hypothetical protein
MSEHGKVTKGVWKTGPVEVRIYGDKEHVIVGFKNEDAEYSLYGSPSVVVNLFRWLAEKVKEIESSATWR